MLEELRICGLGVIDDAVLELSPGLTVVTGETGAGKTMVVSGLGLLFGARADPGAVRPGARSAVLEGRLALEPDVPALARAQGAGAQLDDGVLLVSRSVSREGRSRAHLGGRAVPVALLAELGGELVAVHGQADQQRLLHPARQRDALDRFAGDEVTGPRGRYAAAYDELRRVQRTLTQITTRARERAQEADLLRFGLEEVERVGPVPGEDVELAAQESRLAHADALRVAAVGAHAALLGDAGGDLGGELGGGLSGSGPGDGIDAAALIAQARRSLEAARALDPELAALADRLGEVGYLLADVAGDLASYAARVDTDDARLAAVQERRAVLNRLLRKYAGAPAVGAPAVGGAAVAGAGAANGPAAGRTAGADGGAGGDAAGGSEGPIEQVLAWAAGAAARLGELDGDDERVEQLRGERDRLLAGLAGLAETLTAARRDAAERFARAVTAELASLAMPHAQLTVAVRQDELPADDSTALTVAGRALAYGPHGVDETELLLAPHPGAAPRPLARGASGGELSRVMLAVEVVFAGADPVPTFVFDEVDAGVGGKAAVEVGRRLARLARSAQVLVVTHLPQVAAYADRHLVVVKSDDGTVTRSGVVALDDEGRVRELARMLAGREESASARAHAEELLGAAARATRATTTA